LPRPGDPPSLFKPGPFLRVTGWGGLGRLFGTDGVRGVLGREMTPELALRLARSFGAWLGPGARVLVGRDTRSGGAALEAAVVAGLIFEGVKPFLAGVLPTPALQYNVARLGFDGGVMVTASHNPPEYNGVKVIGADGVEVPREAEREIEEIFFEGRFGGVDWRGLTLEPAVHSGAIELYIDGVVGEVDRGLVASKLAGSKVVVDCGGGAAWRSTPEIVKRLGLKPVALNCSPDPHFAAREPEPTPESLADAAATVRAVKAVAGVGHDGDADRAIIVDEVGMVRWGDRTGALLSLHAAETRGLTPRRVYTAVSSSVLVEEYLKPHGIEVVWTPVGSVVISHMLKREGGISGFEENGGYIHPPHLYARDGGMTLALTLEMLARSGGKLSSLYEALPRYEAYKTKIPVPPGGAECALNAVKRLFKGRVIEIDGVKIVGDGYWLLVRKSGTEPVIRVMAEARTREEARKIAEEAVKAIEEECGGR